MRILIIGLILAGALGLSWLNISAPRPAEASDGWKPLFDGVSLSGWRGYRESAPGNGWKIHDGEVSRESGAGDLVTVDEFGDFELSLEWKIGRGGNSGIIYRVGLGESDTFETGPEYQLLDDQHAHESGAHLAGSVYDLAAPTEDATRPFDTWNETRIVVRGWKIQHWLNGHKVAELDLASPDGKKIIADSKFGAMPKFATLLRGHIALQDHGDPVSFRKIQIREIN
jgi:hypothetical protein